MSRKPKQGDFIHFDVEQHKGKSRATKARIEGVKANSSLRFLKVINLAQAINLFMLL